MNFLADILVFGVILWLVLTVLSKLVAWLDSVDVLKDLELGDNLLFLFIPVFMLWLAFTIFGDVKLSEWWDLANSPAFSPSHK